MRTPSFRSMIPLALLIGALSVPCVFADQVVYFVNGKAIMVKTVERGEELTYLEMQGGGRIGVPTDQIARIEDFEVSIPGSPGTPAPRARQATRPAPAATTQAASAPPPDAERALAQRDTPVGTPGGRPIALAEGEVRDIPLPLTLAGAGRAGADPGKAVDRASPSTREPRANPRQARFNNDGAIAGPGSAKRNGPRRPGFMKNFRSSGGQRPPRPPAGEKTGAKKPSPDDPGSGNDSDLLDSP